MIQMNAEDDTPARLKGAAIELFSRHGIDGVPVRAILQAALVRNSAGIHYYFVDRTKDAIRRRGENISSLELEGLILKHPSILECAIIGVPSEYGEDDVMAILAPVSGKELEVEEVLSFMRDSLPYFMVPRYIRLMKELPKTPSAKVLKSDLRKEGVTPDTWDREAAGIHIRSERLA